MPYIPEKGQPRPSVKRVTPTPVPLRPELKKWRMLLVYSTGTDLHRIVKKMKEMGIPVRTYREVISRLF